MPLLSHEQAIYLSYMDFQHPATILNHSGAVRQAVSSHNILLGRIGVLFLSLWTPYLSPRVAGAPFFRTVISRAMPGRRSDDKIDVDEPALAGTIGRFKENEVTTFRII